MSPSITWVSKEYGIVMYDGSIEVVKHQSFAESYDEAVMKALEAQSNEPPEVTA